MVAGGGGMYSIANNDDYLWYKVGSLGQVEWKLLESGNKNNMIKEEI